MRSEATPVEELVFGITGASGAPLALALFTELIKHDMAIHLIFTVTGLQLFQMETGIKADAGSMIEKASETLARRGCNVKAKVHQYSPTNFFAPPASGSRLWDAMVICPASAGMCGRIAGGSGDDLVARCADVAIKEKRKIVLVVRESPMSPILLGNLLELSRAGVVVLPPVLTYYHRPTGVEDMERFWVGRVLDALGLSHDLLKRWGEYA